MLKLLWGSAALLLGRRQRPLPRYLPLGCSLQSRRQRNARAGLLLARYNLIAERVFGLRYGWSQLPVDASLLRCRLGGELILRERTRALRGLGGSLGARPAKEVRQEASTRRPLPGILFGRSPLGRRRPWSGRACDKARRPPLGGRACDKARRASLGRRASDEAGRPPLGRQRPRTG